MTFPVPVDDARDHITTALVDDALQLLLDAAEQAITGRFGALEGLYDEGLVETHDGGQSYIFLRRKAASIESITETDGTTDTVLAADDYRIRDDGVSVLRLGTGTNPRSFWGGPVRVAYSFADVDAEYARVQLALVQLDLNHNPGLTSETIGSWSQSSNSGVDYQAERELILDSLNAAMAPGFA